MPDAPRYWSEAFIEAFVDALNRDDAFQKAARRFSDTIVLRCLDTPDGQDVEAAYTFEHGRVTDVGLWMEDAPSEALRSAPFDKGEALARATASYPTWIRMDKGELNAVGALASPDYKIEGPMFKIMANLGVFNGMTDVASRVEKTY